MATNAPTLRLRFRLNHQTGKASNSKDLQRASKNFASAIINDVGLQYAEREYENLNKNIRNVLKADVQQEIEHIARQYRRFIVGSEANTRKMRGELTTAAKTKFDYSLDSQSLRDQPIGGKAWANRKRRYLNEKYTSVGHQRWFDHTTLLGKVMSRGSLWTNAFGPITVRLTRVKSTSDRASMEIGGKTTTAQSSKLFATTAARIGTFSVARIEVGAFGKITPAMLPALVDGQMDAPYAEDGRKTGLVGLLGNVSRPAAWRVGGGPNVPYRHTLEPFLAFALTRSIPRAVFNRIQRGLGTDVLGRGYTFR